MTHARTCHNFFRQIQDNGLHFPGFASIFWDRAPPLNFFFNYRPIVIFRYAETQWYKIVKNLISLLDGRRENF